MKTIKLPIDNIVIKLTEKDPERPELYIAGTINERQV